MPSLCVGTHPYIRTSPNYGTVQHNSYLSIRTVLYVIHCIYPVFPLFVSNPNVYNIKRLLLNHTQKARIVDPEIFIPDPTSEMFRIQIRIIFSQ
jgi:hypothetical protein